MHRAYHALPPLSTKKGELVNAVYGFTSTLLNVIEKFRPDYVVAAFDLPGPTFRHKEFKNYKATRIKAPDEFYSQIPRVKEVVRAFNIPILEKEGFEADDIIGTIAKKNEKTENNLENIIITGDLDTLQLVSDKTKVYTMSRGISNAFLYDKEKVRERYGLIPEQLKDFKGLRGDASDNIPGVGGIGEKTAAELLQNFGTLENIYRMLPKIKPSIREKLERDKTIALLSKKLGTIKINVPLEFDINSSVTHDFERLRISNLFQELNFYSLLKRIPAQKEKEEKTASLAGEGVKETKHIIVSRDNSEEFLGEAGRQKELAIAVAPDLGVAFSWKTGRSYFVKFSQLQDELKNILEKENISKIGYDLKIIYKELKKAGINLEALKFDIMLGAYLLDPGSTNDLEKI